MSVIVDAHLQVMVASLNKRLIDWLLVIDWLFCGKCERWKIMYVLAKIWENRWFYNNNSINIWINKADKELWEKKGQILKNLGWI